MKTMILTTLMILTATSAQAAKDCAASQNGTLRLLSSATADIVSQAAKDERVAIDRTSEEYKQLNAVGIVKIDNTKLFGTGFMVDKCHVLTNYHVVYGDKKDGQINKKVYFSVGQKNGSKSFSHQAIEGKVIARGKFGGTIATENNDWAIIKLSKSVGDDVGSIPLYQKMNPEQSAGRAVVATGFPGSKTSDSTDFSNLYGDMTCKILGTNLLGFLTHTCQATSGQSGGPILSKGNDGIYYAIGMISGSRNYTGMDRIEDSRRANTAINFLAGTSNNGVSAGDKIAEALKNDKCD